MERHEVMQQGMEQELANMKASADEHINQVEHYSQKIEEALQEAIARASEAEMRVRELENIRVAQEEQSWRNSIHQWLWTPDRSGVPVPQVMGNSNTEPVQESNMDAVEELPMQSDMDMNEVNRMFKCKNVLYKLISLIGTL